MPDTKHALAYSVADCFAEVLREWLNGAEFAEMRERNRRDPSADTCASHDFCDANMAMHEAFSATLGREPAFLEGTDENGDHAPQGEADIALWNVAWAIAAERHLMAATGEPSPREKLTAQYEAWVSSHGYADFQGDATELVMAGRITSQADAQWVGAFVEQWEAMENAEQKR